MKKIPHSKHPKNFAEVTRTIATKLDTTVDSPQSLDKLLQQMVDLVPHHFGYNIAHIFVVFNQEKWVEFRAGCGPFAEHFDKKTLSVSFHGNESIAIAGRMGEVIHIENVPNDDRYQFPSLPDVDIQAQFIIPLVFGNSILGVLDIQSEDTDAFNDDDQYLLEAFTSIISVALQNGVLFYWEQWRRKISESLRQVADMVSAKQELEDTLTAILHELVMLIAPSIATIWLKTERGYELKGGYPLRDYSPLIIVSEHSPLIIDSHSWFDKIIESEMPLDHQPDDESTPLTEIFPFNHAAIGAKLQIEENVLGVLVIVYEQTRLFGREGKNLAQIFATQIAIVVENTRLYYRARTQSKVNSGLLNIVEATYYLDTLDEVLSAITHTSLFIAPVEACAVWLYQPENNAYHISAQYNFSATEATCLENTSLNDKNILVEHLAKNKKPVIFPVKAITSYLPHDFEKVFAEKTLRFAPLLDLEILDAMLMMVINPTILITKEHQHLMNGIAHQSALAIQRVRLIEAQREEAYVSTALLQVAQNLARTINLPHVLDMVTRLTPMLVGVTQCFIFLANDKASLVPPGASNLGLTDKASLVPPGASCYRLEAMYGVDGFDIHPKTPCDYWQELPSLIRDSVQYPIDVGNRLPPILQAVFPHGQLHTFLFPLQAQGNLIGCLLVGDTKMPILSLRREIITGIAYQTALAIDNAMLHAEHMNQKQLQHDLELARDIQRSFMPQDLPTLHDWDMATRWEMAHKVGGDFFDLISLSKHHLLIIIADVANKGLPAALFMAKTISLIRVTSLELSEPAEILDRVNKLLLPDSSGGMFVTVFCAVLERETGHLKYTSGGHNPPILLRKSGESIMLRTQGIILGVFDGMDFEQKSDTLHVGDGVLFYTDGVTEAFNSDDEMFGEDRLLHVLKENWHCSADEIAGKIQKSINDFAYPRSQSDDFTLLLVKRT